MKDDELKEFAAKFINLWQENFSKAIADGKIVESMMQAANNMQQFYDNKARNESFAAAFPNPFEPRPGEHGRGGDDGRIDELERRIAALEKKSSSGLKKNKPGGKK